MLDAVRLRIVSLAVRGTGTARLLRPAFSAPPTARGAMAGPHPLFERRDVAGENLNVIFSAGKTEEEFCSCTVSDFGNQPDSISGFSGLRSPF